MIDFLVSFSLLIVSLAALLFVADKLINHSIRLASILGVSGTVIGLTLLAYGTSLPELAVSSISSFGGHDELSVSNIVGSNMYNVAVIMGLVALLVPFAWKENLRRDGWFMMATALLLILLGFIGGIGTLMGLAMCAVLIGYTYYVIRKEGERHPYGSAHKKKHTGSARKEFIYCIVFLLGVLAAGNFTVMFAIEAARAGGISEWLIGSTIVAAGTSLPETVVSIVSARKKQMGMSLGNIIGSNYFNVMLILGASALVKPISFTLEGVWVDLVFMNAVTALFLFALHRGRLKRWEGAAFIGIYILFVAYLLGLLGI
jgi:cation:H+ antiporter